MHPTFGFSNSCTATGLDAFLYDFCSGPRITTYTRDSYTGLDYADQRFYASTYGRFNTPDPYMASGGPSDPGSWNRYSYTQGDPVNRFDPSGNAYCDVSYADAVMPCTGSGATIGSPTYLGCAADDFAQTSGPNDCYSMGFNGRLAIY